ncbi:MAG: 30S ribosomal protein S20 [Cyanobacteria bacterium NC_groundwater_1444_Ag_S-0.65um_54_12]|nr:30S ribosomal protein S20 [Cyanobacteria bacterium NC_groundwater_1444_Ag_S-0.65um_54_12]
MAKRIKSAIKRAQIAERNRQRNVAVRSEVKTRIKRTHEAAVSGEDPDKVVELLRKAISTIDRAARKGVLHRNAAARRKSRLAKALLAKGVSCHGTDKSSEIV